MLPRNRCRLGKQYLWAVHRPPGLTNVVGIAAGERHSFAIRADGTVVGWGSSQYGLRNLGRCVQGLDLNNDLLNETIAALLISASGCENHPGPKIYFGGDANLSGLCAKLILRNNVKGTHIGEWETTITLIPDGAPLTIPKQPSQGGSGVNPLIWIQFLQGNGDAIGDPQFLGRCNKL
jgi:hypothetical protein